MLIKTIASTLRIGTFTQGKLLFFREKMEKFHHFRFKMSDHQSDHDELTEL